MGFEFYRFLAGRYAFIVGVDKQLAIWQIGWPVIGGIDGLTAASHQ